MRAALLMIALAAVGAASADDNPVDLSNSGVRGRVSRIVTPEYPADAVSRNLSGIVAVEGKVQWNGYMQDIRYIPDTPESQVFVDAVRYVAPKWIFVAPIDAECQPSPHAVRTEVSFEMDKGTPRIFVTTSKAAGGPVPKDRPYFRPVVQNEPTYPVTMQRLSVAARTYAKLTVDRGGNVVMVEPHTYSTMRNPADLQSFDWSVESSLKEWKFPPVPA